MTRKIDAETVSRVVCDTLAIEEADPQLDLFETGLLDSLSLVNLMATIEEEFSIRISPGELDFEDFRTIDSITELIQKIYIHSS